MPVTVSNNLKVYCCAYKKNKFQPKQFEGFFWLSGILCLGNDQVGCLQQTLSPAQAVFDNIAAN